MKESLKEIFVILRDQLILANETVEYTSWLTASIFSVLGVFTIFLSHQYQNHTSELKKLIWKMRNNIKKNDPIEFEQNVVDFEYFSKTPKVLKKAVQTSFIVLWVLIPIWTISGFSTLFFILEKEGPIHYFSLILTIVVTSLFIFFSMRLAIILSSLSDTEEGIEILTVKELFNAKNLVAKNFDLPKLLILNNTTWSFLISGDAPYAKVKIESAYGIYNCSILLVIKSIGHEVYISVPISPPTNETLTSELQINLEEQKRINLQRFFNESEINQMNVSQVLLIEDTYYYFKGQIAIKENLITTSLLETRKKFDIPTVIKKDFENNIHILDINKSF
ncbi:hypothetical protein [Jeotgalibacillus sp. R-1-5s-1]|uniref:hypothetical protein n=1 Tax=Jeotgalibacillus sp. R-1-5s-1 TaxID=2555897 RepID=UPI00106C2517|nr:hypothetical protein [Jeotgalibacillus sp. R-1-5s-1]TFD94316.1 hypothetical protein E2491_12780 [Jeotgalibacillus sp. R-1-5s-1]